MANPIIGILVNKSKPLADYVLDSIEIKLLVFSPKDINWSDKTTLGYLYNGQHWVKGVYPLPNAVYNRRYTSRRKIVDRLEKLIGQGKVFNHITRLDKWKIYQILRDSHVQPYLPTTFLYSQSNLIKLLDKYGQVILKPRRGQLGRRVYLVEKTEDNEYRLFINMYKNNTVQESFHKQGINIDEKLLVPARIKTTDQQKFVEEVQKLISKKPFIIQEFITLDQINHQIYDIRMYVQKDGTGLWTVSGGFSRVASPNSYISNLCIELKSHQELIMMKNNQFSLSNLSKIEKISIDVAKTIESKLGHFGELGVDFGLDQNGKPWIIEVNGRTQKKFIKRLKDSQLTKKIYSKPIKYAYFLATTPSLKPSISHLRHRLADIFKRLDGKEKDD